MAISIEFFNCLILYETHREPLRQGRSDFTYSDIAPELVVGPLGSHNVIQRWLIEVVYLTHRL